MKSFKRGVALVVMLVMGCSVFAKPKKTSKKKSTAVEQTAPVEKVVTVEKTAPIMSVQVVLPELENITGGEKNWLGGQIQDKIKSNLQEYLGMKTFVDAKSETALLKVQKQSENSSHDESTAIELGKITSAKFALLRKIRKTNKG